MSVQSTLGQFGKAGQTAHRSGRLALSVSAAQRLPRGRFSKWLNGTGGRSALCRQRCFAHLPLGGGVPRGPCRPLGDPGHPRLAGPAGSLVTRCGVAVRYRRGFAILAAHPLGLSLPSRQNGIGIINPAPSPFWPRRGDNWLDILSRHRALRAFLGQPDGANVKIQSQNPKRKPWLNLW